jgi:ribosomal protein S17E
VLNRIRKLAQELLAKHPNLFSANFDSNKKALTSVAVIHSTLLRNRLAGTITTMVRNKTPPGEEAPVAEDEREQESEPAETSSAEKQEEIAQAAV